MNEFLEAHQHGGWRLSEPHCRTGLTPFDQNREVYFCNVTPPTGYQPGVKRSHSHWLRITFAERKLIIEEIEDRGYDFSLPVLEIIDDEWYLRFASVEWA